MVLEYLHKDAFSTKKGKKLLMQNWRIGAVDEYVLLFGGKKSWGPATKHATMEQTFLALGCRPSFSI